MYLLDKHICFVSQSLCEIACGVHVLFVCTCASCIGVCGGEACVHADNSTAFAGLDRFHSVSLARTYVHISKRTHIQTIETVNGTVKLLVNNLI